MKQKLIALLSKITFAIGCLAVAIYTRLRDLFSKKEVLPMAHDCSYPYPTDEQTMEAGGNLFHMAVTPADRDTACIVHCCYALEGYTLSKGFPHQPVVYGTEAVPDLEQTYAKLAEELKPLAVKGAAQESAVGLNLNWAAIRQIIAFLLNFLPVS